MISRIRNWLRNRKLIRSVDVTGFGSSILDPVHKEDMRAIKDVKSFNASFDQQQQKMQARAMVPHDSTCDVITCNKVSCFQVEPDKIIKTTRKRIKKTIQGD